MYIFKASCYAMVLAFSHWEGTLMAAEEILRLFDSYWFEQEFFRAKQSLASSKTMPIHQEYHEVEELKFCSLPSLQFRSLWLNTSSSPVASSPRSVFTTPKLQKILSGKEIRVEEQEKTEMPYKKKDANRRRMKGISRSLSDLEVEELKGFMDLGFVFTEEDKMSRLASIIPGLQRWGEKTGEQAGDDLAVSRPYLSEAWDVFDQRKVNESLMHLRFPASYNENNMKDHLKAWAYTVASTVR